MTVTVNGRAYEVDAPLTVEVLLGRLGRARDDIAIAVDGAVVPRSMWANAPVADGAVVEIVTARQGG